MRERFSGSMIIVAVAAAVVSVVISVSITRASAQTTVQVPQFKYDPSWPKPLPDGWVLGSVGSVCVDARDHVFVVTRGQPAPKERNLATPAPPVIEFDADGNVVNSWGNRAVMAKTAHGCFIDKDGNFWTAGNNDGIVQKYTHDGSKILLQIGTKGIIVVHTKTAHRANSENTVGTAGSIGFSPDPAQKFIYVANGSDNVIHILDRTTGEALSKFGRPGNQPGDLTDPHSIAVNSKGDIIIGEVPYGGKLQMWRAVGKQKHKPCVRCNPPRPHPFRRRGKTPHRNTLQLSPST